LTKKQKRRRTAARPSRRANVKRRVRKAATPVVAVVNTNDDLVMALRSRLLDEGYAIVTAHIRDIKSGREDFAAFVRSHDPDVIIYDIAIPYEDNWTFLHTLRELPECAKRRFIVTTVNKRVLDERVGRTDAVELVGGHADDFEPLVDAVAAAVKVSER
jgi:CheY-like chemotaxis protein